MSIRARRLPSPPAGAPPAVNIPDSVHRSSASSNDALVGFRVVRLVFDPATVSAFFAPTAPPAVPYRASRVLPPASCWSSDHAAPAPACRCGYYVMPTFASAREYVELLGGMRLSWPIDRFIARCTPLGVCIHPWNARTTDVVEFRTPSLVYDSVVIGPWCRCGKRATGFEPFVPTGHSIDSFGYSACSVPLRASCARHLCSVATDAVRSLVDVFPSTTARSL